MSLLKLSNITIPFELFTRNKDTRVVLEGISPVHEYVDGKVTETITGYRYRVQLPYNDNQTVFVKILGEPLITEEEIKNAGDILITFTDVKVKLYTNKKNFPDYSISASGFNKEDA